MLSFTLELLQNYLPQRVSSNLDLLLNAMGTALGVGIGLLLDTHGGIERWQMVRDRWFVARSAGGMALLLLWPIGLLFPTAVPFGLGHVLGRVQPVVAEMLQGTSAEGWAAGWADAAAAPGGARDALGGERARRSSSSACSRPAWWPSRSPCRAGGAARW